MDYLGPNMPLVGPNFLVGEEIGKGNFGEIRLGTDMWTNKKVAIKFESCKGKPVSLDLEDKYYKQIGEVLGFPKVHYFGRCGRFNVLVMDLLGPSLDTLFDALEKKFSLKTVCEVATQMISRVEYVHSKYLIYRDIKPDNFLIGTNSSNDHIIHLIDFGLAKEYMNPSTGEHIAYSETHSMTGTVRYMSINTHEGKEASRRDDLESLGYVLVYFLKGTLPWQGVTGYTIQDRYTLVSELKKNTPLQRLCEGLPEEFATYLRITRNLDFFETPDYTTLKALFTNLMKKNNFTRDFKFDWNDKLKSGSLSQLLVQSNPLKDSTATNK